MTISSLLDIGSKSLLDAHISNYKKETEWILLDIIGKDLGWLLVNKGYILDSNDIDTFLDHIYLRCNHVPIQLILGSATFYGRDFCIFPDVFIPRQDSEVIIDYLKKKDLIQHFR